MYFKILISFIILIFCHKTFGFNSYSFAKTRQHLKESNFSVSTPPILDLSAQTLKIILFFALLFISLFSCGLPILILDCLLRKTETLRGVNNESIDINLPTNGFNQQNLTYQQDEISLLPPIAQNPPITFFQKRILKIWIARISCFAGGVFLAAGFMDLFSDVNEAFEVAKKTLGIESNYPFPGLFTLLGFFTILTLEQGIASTNQHHLGHESHHQNFSQVNDSMSTTSIEEVVEHNFFKTFSLLVAISIHSIFEGLAVGLQPTYNQTFSIFLALVIHKVIIAVSIGINLAMIRVKSDGLTDIPHRKSIIIQITSTLVFAFASPIGVLIGWGVIQETQSGALELSTAVLQGLACGTFLFVVFCEILPDEFRHESTDKLIKLLFLFFGFLLIAIYIYFMD